MTLTLTLTATDVTVLEQALEVIKNRVVTGVTNQAGYDTDYSYDFEVIPDQEEAEDPEYDWDGQPDEAQEWYDFSPDA